jgi:thioesterase domain-containing protein
MEELAKLYIDAVRKVYPSGPFHMCGYSAGATVAYAMATRLVEAGETTGKLVILDGLNWHHYRNMPLREQARFWWTVATNRTGRYWQNLANGHLDVIAYSLGYLVHRKIQRWTWQIARKLFSYTDRPLPKAVKSNMELFTSMAETYEPRNYPGDVLLIRTMPRDIEYNLNPTLGWEKVATGGVRVTYIGGDHLTFMQEPNVGPLVDVLVSHLQEKS